MPATVIAEPIGWDHGITILRDRVAELLPCSGPPTVPRTFFNRVKSWSSNCGARDAHPARLRPGRGALGGHVGKRVPAVHGGVDGAD